MNTNHRAGHDAEKRAAKWLETQGFKIIELNWKTPRCEIDIVAKRNDTIHFIEVKYRKSSLYGSGLDYITDKKLKQMAYAAQSWVHANEWEHDYQLSALQADPNGFELIENV